MWEVGKLCYHSRFLLDKYVEGINKFVDCRLYILAKGELGDIDKQLVTIWALIIGFM